MNDSNLPSVPEDEEISLLDLLQTIADNLRLGLVYAVVLEAFKLGS